MEALGFLICILVLVAFFSFVSSAISIAMKIIAPILGGAVFFYIITQGVLGSI